MDDELRRYSTGTLRRELERRDKDDRPQELHQEADTPMSAGSRASGRQMLENRIKQLSTRACGLQILLDSIPVQLSQEADEALWQLVLDAKE